MIGAPVGESVFQRSVPTDSIQGWKPVRIKKTRQDKNMGPRYDSIGTEKAPAKLFRRPQGGSAEPGNLFLGHDPLDVIALALDAIARAAVCLDRQAGHDGVDAALLRRGASLWALLLVMNVVVDREVVGHRQTFH